MQEYARAGARQRLGDGREDVMIKCLATGTKGQGCMLVVKAAVAAAVAHGNLCSADVPGNTAPQRSSEAGRLLGSRCCKILKL